MKTSRGTTVLDIFLFRLEILLKRQHKTANKCESLFSAKSKDEPKKINTTASCDDCHIKNV